MPPTPTPESLAFARRMAAMKADDARRLDDQLSAGDPLLWDVDGRGAATVRRVERLDAAYLGAVDSTLGEWSSDADDEAYGSL